MRDHQAGRRHQATVFGDNPHCAWVAPLRSLALQPPRPACAALGLLSVTGRRGGVLDCLASLRCLNLGRHGRSRNADGDCRVVRRLSRNDRGKDVRQCVSCANSQVPNKQSLVLTYRTCLARCSLLVKTLSHCPKPLQRNIFPPLTPTGTIGSPSGVKFALSGRSLPVGGGEGIA